MRARVRPTETPWRPDAVSAASSMLCSNFVDIPGRATRLLASAPRVEHTLGESAESLARATGLRGGNTESFLVRRAPHGHAVQDRSLRARRGDGQQGSKGRVRAHRRVRWYHERLSPCQRIDATVLEGRP